MAISRYLVLVFLLFFPYLLFAQQKELSVDFSRADSVAMAVKYNGDIFRLTRQLTDPFSSQLLKTRAIFKWITENIAYDNKYFNKYNYKGREPKTYRCDEDNQECEINKQVWENGYVMNVLDKGKGVCEGYALLFKKMCTIAGIDAEMVTGYVRTEDYEVGTAGELDHAWNAVRINGNYYLLDPTWAAGGCRKDDDGKLLPFHKHFNNFYWLTPPEDFAKNHYPEDPKWVLLANYSKDKFSLNPYYAAGEVENIKLLAPQSGIIHAKRGDTVRFKLNYKGVIHFLQINSNTFQNPDLWTYEDVGKHKNVKVLDSAALKRQRYVPYRQIEGAYEFAYVVKDNTLDYLDILFDTRKVMRFKVKMSR